jgi:hypothetical protein
MLEDPGFIGNHHVAKSTGSHSCPWCVEVVVDISGDLTKVMYGHVILNDSIPTVSITCIVE